MAKTIDEALNQRGIGIRRAKLERWTGHIYESGKSLGKNDLLKAEKIRHRCKQVMAGFMNNYDVILTPTMPAPPLRIGEMNTMADYFTDLSRLQREMSAYCSLFNVTGQPAISIPVDVEMDGLPIGVQIVTHHGKDKLALQLAAQFERSQPWNWLYERMRRELFAASSPQSPWGCAFF